MNYGVVVLALLAVAHAHEHSGTVTELCPLDASSTTSPCKFEVRAAGGVYTINGEARPALTLRRGLGLLLRPSLLVGKIGTPRTLERTLLVPVPLLHLFRVRRLGTSRLLALCGVLGHAGGVLSGILDVLGLARHAW